MTLNTDEADRKLTSPVGLRELISSKESPSHKAPNQIFSFSCCSEASLRSASYRARLRFPIPLHPSVTASGAWVLPAPLEWYFSSSGYSASNHQAAEVSVPTWPSRCTGQDFHLKIVLSPPQASPKVCAETVTLGYFSQERNSPSYLSYGVSMLLTNYGKKWDLEAIRSGPWLCCLLTSKFEQGSLLLWGSSSSSVNGNRNVYPPLPPARSLLRIAWKDLGIISGL